MSDPRNKRPPIPQWRQGVGTSIGKRDQSLSSVYSSPSAVPSTPRTATTNNTPKTPPSPSPLRNFTRPEDDESSATDPNPKNEEDFDDVLNELHEAMWKDIITRKPNKYTLNEESGLYERKKKRIIVVEDSRNSSTPQKEEEVKKDINKNDNRYHTLPSAFHFPASGGMGGDAPPPPFTPQRDNSRGGTFTRGHYRGPSGSPGSFSAQHNRNFSWTDNWRSPSTYGHNRNIGGEGSWRGFPSNRGHYATISGERSWRGSPSARGHHRYISGEGSWRGSPSTRGHFRNLSWRAPSTPSQRGNLGGENTWRGSPSTRGHHRNVSGEGSWRRPSTHGHLKNFAGGGSWRAPSVKRDAFPDGPHGSSKFLQSQLHTIRLNSMMSQNKVDTIDAKNDDEQEQRGRRPTRDHDPTTEEQEEPKEKKAFRIRVHTSLSPPVKRKPIRLSDSLKPSQPFNFKPFKKPPRRELCEFTVYHADFEDDSSSNPETWLKDWNDKHQQPFSRLSSDMQWQVRIQRKEPVNGFKHPIAPEYEGCPTLPLIARGLHFRDIRPTENKTLQENARRATNRPAMQDQADRLPRHDRILTSFPEHRMRADMPKILNQFLVGDLKKLDKILKKFLKGDKTIDRSTLDKYPELYVFDPTIDESGADLSPISSEKSSSPPDPSTPSTPEKRMSTDDDLFGENKPVFSNRSSSPVWKHAALPDLKWEPRQNPSFADPQIREIFEALEDPPPHIRYGRIESGQPKKGPPHFSVLRSYSRAIVGWNGMHITGRPIPQTMCPKFDGKNGVIYLEEHRFENIVQLMEAPDPLLAPLVRDVTSPAMQRWLEITEPECQEFEGIRHTPMSPFIPTPRGFGRWGEFRWIAATGHWILYFFPKPYDWSG